jgi:succinyl-CoA synthetase beta subunit
MRLFESEAKELLAERGLPVPQGVLVTRRGDLPDWGESVAKAQVLRGGRMKAGLVRFASDLETLAAETEEILAAVGPDEECAGVLVEERLPIEAEAYLGVLYDPRARVPVLIYSAAGGIDVEEGGPAVKIAIDPAAGIADFELRGALREAGVGGSDLRALTAAASLLVSIFLEFDATLVEVNPLAKISGGAWTALDCHLELDGDALGRHRDLVDRFALSGRGEGARRPSEVEVAAAEIDSLDHRGVAGRLVEFDGDLALIIGGGGASLTVFDALRDAGASPANYCEVGGNPSVRKVAAFTRLLLERFAAERVAVIMNVVSNTRADLVARGVIEGCIEAGRTPAEAIAVYRVPGAWEEESDELLGHYGLRNLGRAVGIEEAAELAARGAAA